MNKPNHKKRFHRSKGEIISTCCFFIAGVFFLGEANILRSEGVFYQSFFIGVCGLLCIAAGLRFQLHNIWQRLKQLQK
jgi:hypothetical protein|tara:strand:+ start:1804 stop:2037 length:234 start_codon:yes stop_codon:yes gene_type:complete